MAKKTYTREQVAELFQVTPRTIDNWRRAGKLRMADLPGRAVRFTHDEIERLLKAKANGLEVHNDLGTN